MQKEKCALQRSLQATSIFSFDLKIKLKELRDMLSACRPYVVGEKVTLSVDGKIHTVTLRRVQLSNGNLVRYFRSLEKKGVLVREDIFLKQIRAHHLNKKQQVAQAGDIAQELINKAINQQFQDKKQT